jgi:hypothetical protein
MGTMGREKGEGDGVNMVEVHYMLVWKDHNATLLYN